MQNYLNELNKAQREAVENYDGASLVIAGAGSGKTRVLTYRIAHLLKLGAKPWSVLSLTFTNKAAREMKDRIASIMGPNVAKYLWMGTFHSIFARILRAEAETIGYPSNFTIYDSADSKSLIKTIIKDMKLDDKTYKPNVVASRISSAKNSLIGPAAYANMPELYEYDQSIRMPFISSVYKEYAKRCFLAGAMDFDDLLMKTNVLFRDSPKVLEKYQQQFDYVLVDEYQDTNYAQYLIIKRLAEKHHNICVVGDDAQSIYSFRGARIENILNFQKDYPDHKVFKLEQNYRSTKTIVNAANSIIAKNKRQIPKNVFSEKEEGNLIKVTSALTDNEEGFLVANQISELRMRNHYKFEDFAILYRTNAQSRIFEESLRKRNIPYKIFGGLSFYQRKEIKDLLAYFRFIINPKDNEAFKRIVNYPARGIGDTTVAKLEQAASEYGLSIAEIISEKKAENPAQLNKGTLSKLEEFTGLMQVFREKQQIGDAFEVATEVATSTGFLKDLYKDQTPEGLSRFENTQELLNGIQEFTLSAREEGQPTRLENYMEDVSLLTDQDSEKEEDRDKVSMMTVHMAKGLEFKNVFVVGLEENLFPSNQNGAKTAEEFEEERRLFYVAVTRAEENAFLSFARQRYKWGKLEFCNPSRFIAEIDENYLDKPVERELSFFDEEPKPKENRPLRNFQTPAQKLVRNPIANSVDLSNKLQKLRDVKKEMSEFDGSPSSEIQAGMTVEHQRFGRGKVLQVEGQIPNLKATVFFQNVGQKQLLLKFAKLKIVRE
ncbi:MAG: ATP-dependent DNA helicase [Bacteroidetes bacterium GWF2_42_66]|nr:MAG: ATP-dependent DNA helicase [Bacteroidetes bacterium GWA2_42_15]OFX97343.1 MAG: ATP-dependent DNA helicase [Bacteroidetes bacterium GWE2_42_39]OFY39980.1 MAG: ATP-dependent DNA helicase [Bacteroidetes bacterium GWF2_42_66]HBL78174.1 ATP-dependent DNA helicase [Prolixibacteraceae bacterium]HCU61126.1 ATP-dependent DNA helicase [Prolixibacteraceae bacterium]